MANSLQRQKVSYLKPVEISPFTDREILESHSEQIAVLSRRISDLTTELKKLQPKPKSRSKIKLIRNDDDETSSLLSRRLRAARIKRGLSIAEVAEHIGVSQSSVYFWEADHCRPRDRNLSALCKVLKLSVRGARASGT